MVLVAMTQPRLIWGNSLHQVPSERCVLGLSCAVLQLDYFTGSSRSALRAVFSSWTLDECHAWLSGREVGLRMVLEEETRKYFPASNSGREVSRSLRGCV